MKMGFWKVSMHINLIAIVFSIILTGCHQIQPSIAIPELNKPVNDIEKVINDIHVGMNKKQVIDILGYPLSTEANRNKECLTYPLMTKYKSEFVLLFENGILTQYNKSQECINLLK